MLYFILRVHQRPLPPTEGHMGRQLVVDFLESGHFPLTTGGLRRLYLAFSCRTYRRTEQYSPVDRLVQPLGMRSCYWCWYLYRPYNFKHILLELLFSITKTLQCLRECLRNEERAGVKPQLTLISCWLDHAQKTHRDQESCW